PASIPRKIYSPMSPIAPEFIINQLAPAIVKYCGKSAFNKKSLIPFLRTVCKYWSLKRELRRGAPLLKRLHLEPWTASASAHRQTEDEKMKKIELLCLMRKDLERKRMLAELCRKREKEKLKQTELQVSYLRLYFFALET